MTYNLEQYEGKRKVATLMWNTSYQLCRGMLKRYQTQRHNPNTYFKIVNNDTRKRSNI